MTLKPFKIRIVNESHSREIQEWLFSLGYKWREGDTVPIFLTAPYLILYKSKGHGELTIMCSANSKWFKEKDLPEKWFYDGKLQDKPQTSLPKEETSMNNIKTYREVAEAILSGQKLQFLDSSGDWFSLNYIGLHEHRLDREFSREVRVKPRYCNGVELDPCLTKYPEKGSYYCYPDPTHVDYYTLESWTGDADDIYWFELGFVYASSDSAAKHGQAMGLYMDSMPSTKPEE